MPSSTFVALRVLVGLGIAAFPVSAVAQAEAGVQARLTPAYRECHARNGGGSFPEARCLGEESARQESKLNTQWRRTLSGMSASEMRSLRQRQRAWIARRYAHCRDEVVANDVIGPTAKLVYNGCYLDLTVRRIMFLEQLH